MTADAIIRALEARRSGSAWMAKCPAHEDSNPSLSIREDGGKVLLHCHAGCSQAAVVDALKARGLWEAAPPTRTWATRSTVTPTSTANCSTKSHVTSRRIFASDIRMAAADGSGRNTRARFSTTCRKSWKRQSRSEEHTSEL